MSAAKAFEPAENQSGILGEEITTKQRPR